MQRVRVDEDKMVQLGMVIVVEGMLDPPGMLDPSIPYSLTRFLPNQCFILSPKVVQMGGDRDLLCVATSSFQSTQQVPLRSSTTTLVMIGYDLRWIANWMTLRCICMYKS